MNFKEMKAIEGYQSPEECLNSILFHAKNIHRDQSAAEFNHGRIASLRALLDLFEQYNDKLAEMETFGVEE